MVARRKYYQVFTCRRIGMVSRSCNRSKEDGDVPVQTEPLLVLKNALTQSFILTTLDEDGKVVDINGNFSKTFNYTLSELYLQDYWSLHSGYHTEEKWGDMWTVVQNGAQWSGELCHRSKKGDLIWLTSTIVPVQSNGKSPRRVLVISTNISKQKEMENWQHIASHHELTNLPNRRMLERVMESSITRAQEKQAQLAVLYMDINRFKLINDTYGHSVGDLFLKAVGNRLQSVAPLQNCVFHVSGDEFIMIIEEMEKWEALVQSVMDLFGQPFTIDRFQIEANISIGMSIYPDHSVDLNRLIAYADSAMYDVKGLSGTNFQKYRSSTSLQNESP